MKETYIALKEFGASFIGPLLTVYVKEVEKHSKGKIPVCLAREGWLLHQLLSQLSDEQLITLDHPPVYLKLSRTLLFRAMLGNPQVYAIALQMDFEGSLCDLLRKRFGLQRHEAYASLPDDILSMPVSLPEDADKVRGTLEPYDDALASFVTPTREASKRYFDAQCFGSENLTPLMLDLGYSGTIQKLCTQLMGRDTAGLYFIATKPGKHVFGSHTAAIKGVFQEGVSWKDDYTLLERSLFLECLMTAPHGQVTDIRQQHNGEYMFFYGREASSQRHYQNLQVILDGAVEAVAEAIRNDVSYSCEEVEAMFEVFATRQGAIPKAAWHLFTADDDITGNGMVNPLQIFGI